MSFHSTAYFCFLALVLSAVALSPTGRRPLVLLVSSWIFYAWQAPWALLFLFAIVGLTWVLAAKLRDGPRRIWLGVDVLAKLLLLILAKIFLPSWSENWIVPVGLVFYSFQSFGYLMDVYRDSRAHIPEPLKLALFISFFPTVMSGPIERAASLVPQLSGERLRPEDNWHNAEAWREIGAGLFKKLVLADALWVFVGPVFRLPQFHGGLELLLALLLARFMIYADFSAYSKIARGTARLFGIDIRVNFDRPFQATSLIDYWRRWHISLHDWMKDYVFIPLANSSIGKQLGVPAALFLSFIFMGLWHEITWTFFAVGVWHGLFMALDLATRDRRQALLIQWGADRVPRIRDLGLRLITLMVFILPPTLLFMASSISDVQLILRQLITGDWWVAAQSASGSSLAAVFADLEATLKLVLERLGGPTPERQALLIRSLALLGVWGIVSEFNLWPKFERYLSTASWPIRYLIYVIWFLALVVWGETWGGAPFVYFSFF
ncbi:MAG TPA: MBOAT family O-acyltransferase [Pseudobdellovibrionaceae bacterium]|nr:MBOAT family O-acyltransferase [Pseudobdellovibrionaceae bacterium]